MPQSLRIIGGKWRSRRFNFPNIAAIRPTPDKLRETLFNWIQFDIQGAVCLDLFAGSGALGLEALSRGAELVYFVDNNKKAIANINNTLHQLDCHNTKVYYHKALNFLNKHPDIFDIVFLDPPFNQDTLVTIINTLITKQIIHKNSLIFIETKQKDLERTINNLHFLKQAKSGQSHIYLARL